MEQWKFLYGNKNFQLSNHGKIRSVDREVPIYRNGVNYFASRVGKDLSQRCSKDNPHLFTCIHYVDDNGNKVQKTIYIHRAVADHFVEKSVQILLAEIEGKTVCATHYDDDYENNHHLNIRWITLGDVIATQPQRLADPTKSWRTRRKKYGKSGSPKKLK
jgi:hypothetical protein